jgi:hypothetical protein
MRAEHGPGAVCLFAGPSLAAAALPEALTGGGREVVLLPPARQGDVLALCASASPPAVIGLVDGFFYQRLAVHFKELLLALEQGIRVLGAASMGALRACELEPFGMRGIGEVFRLYQRRRIDGDDEVAVLHGDASTGFVPLTDALVNMRHTFAQAAAAGVISRRTQGRLVAEAKRLHFTERRYPAVLDALDGELAADEREDLARYLREHAVDLKRQDALLLVDALAEAPLETPAGVPGSWRLNRTLFFCAFERQYRAYRVLGRDVPERRALALHKLLADGVAREWDRHVRRCLALDEAAHRRLERGDASARTARLRAAEGLEDDAAFAGWLEARHLTEGELARCLTERDLEARVLAELGAGSEGEAAAGRRLSATVSARLGLDPRVLARRVMMRPGVPWEGPLVRELKLRGAFGEVLARAARVAEFNEEFSAGRRDAGTHLGSEGLRRWVALRWDVAVEDVDDALLDRGFLDARELVETARDAFFFAELSAGRARD